MSKLGHVLVENSVLDSLSEHKEDADPVFLKKQAEAEIRTKLDKFAKELSKAKSQRDKH